MEEIMMNTKTEATKLAQKATAFDFYDVMMDLSYEQRADKMDEINEKLGFKLLDIHEMFRYEMKLKNTNEERETLADKINQIKKDEEVLDAEQIARDMKKGYMQMWSAQLT